MLADKVQEQSISTLEGVVRKALQSYKYLSLEFKNRGCFWALYRFKNACVWILTLHFSWVTVDKILKHSATFSYFVHKNDNVTPSVVGGED